jgi:hypothetical protein
MKHVSAIAKDENCLEIHSDDFGVVNVKVLDDERKLMVKMENIAIKEPLTICLYTGKPMFVEVQEGKEILVQYVKFSGKDLYN